MQKKIFFTLQIVLFYLLSQSITYSQQFNTVSNGWINFNQPYVKISISKKGIYKIPFSSLPSDFPKSEPDKFQLFYRGNEISILSTSNNEILFYGVPNDGGMDSLLYRPTTGRINKLSSLYSDESSYFLTKGTENGKRASIVSTGNGVGEIYSYHLERFEKIFTSSYSQSTEDDHLPDFLNSFFELGASKSGPVLVRDTIVDLPFKLNNIVRNSIRPRLKILLHGRSNISRSLQVSVGKSKTNMRVAGNLNLIGFSGEVFEFEMDSNDINEDGSGIIQVQSTSKSVSERFSIGFYTIDYPQAVRIQDEIEKVFNFTDKNSQNLSFKIEGLKDDFQIYDITDIRKVDLITKSSGNFLLPKAGDRILLVSNVVNVVTNDKITSLHFQKIDPRSYNYLIVTNDVLEASAKKYAAYRGSAEGGAYKTLVVKMTQLYDQFNYGEVSPIATKRFANFILSDGNLNKYLFLIGKSIGVSTRIPKNLEGEVPSVGYPSSDILLVSGLGGLPEDVPAIPIGRLMATSEGQVEDYLRKVQTYENNTLSNFSWKKQILHLNGGHDRSEIEQFSNALARIAPIVEEGPLGGEVKAFVKKSTIEVEPVDITTEVNQGIGMLTYFGHGSTSKTDLDFGYITDPKKGYSNSGKYPFIYFNGCGVGNIFRGNYNSNLSASDKRPLSLDWILSPDKGAIAIMANSASSYVSTTIRYLEELYPAMFSNPNTMNKSLGQIQKEVASKIVSTGLNRFDIANIHQSVLQGDPAIHLIPVLRADYSVSSEKSITINSNSSEETIGKSAMIHTSIVVSNLGLHIKNEKIPVRVTYVYFDGSKEVRTGEVISTSVQDTIVFITENKKSISRILVDIDPEETLTELTISNNKAELEVEWTLAKDLVTYPTDKLVDLTPPRISVTFDGRMIKNNDVIQMNPKISVLIEDDRVLPADKSLLNIYIKPCNDEGCNFEAINLDQASVSFIQVSENSFLVTFKSDIMLVGSYELLVNSRDKSGNIASPGYKISFNMREINSEMILSVSPNPASDYVVFDLSGLGLMDVNEIEWYIYDTRGIIHENRKLNIKSKDRISWNWIPKVSSGTYPYKINMKFSGGSEKQISGKVVIVR